MTNGCVFQTADSQTSRKHEDLLPHGPDALNRKELAKADWSVTSHRLTLSRELLNTHPSLREAFGPRRRRIVSKSVGSDHRSKSRNDMEGWSIGAGPPPPPSHLVWSLQAQMHERMGEISNMTIIEIRNQPTTHCFCRSVLKTQKFPLTRHRVWWAKPKEQEKQLCSAQRGVVSAPTASDVLLFLKIFRLSAAAWLPPSPLPVGHVQQRSQPIYHTAGFCFQAQSLWLMTTIHTLKHLALFRWHASYHSSHNGLLNTGS